MVAKSVGLNGSGPGFDLGLKMKECLDDNPGIRGIMLGSHGLFTWGDTAYESYINTLETIEKCAEYLEQHYGKEAPFSADRKYKVWQRLTAKNRLLL